MNQKTMTSNVFRTIMQNPRWIVIPRREDARTFEKALHVSGYWTSSSSLSDEAAAAEDDRNHDVSHSTSSIPEDTRHVFCRVLRQTKRERLADFIRYFVIQVQKSGLAGADDLYESSEINLDALREALLESASMQLAFVTCMQHYFI